MFISVGTWLMASFNKFIDIEPSQRLEKMVV